MNKKLTDKIEKFLAEKRKSTGGYAEIIDKDLHALHDIIRELVKAKCQSDPDGDYPIEVQLTNRRTHRRPHNFAIPYDSWIVKEHRIRDGKEPMTEEEAAEHDEQRLDLMLCNLQTANSEVNTELSIRSMHRREKKAKK